MANGAGRIFNVFKNTSEANAQTSRLVTVTVNTLNPLTFILDDRIKLTEDFVQLDSDIDRNKLTIGTKLEAISLNNGQLYYIQVRKSIRKDDTELLERISTLESKVATLEDKVSSLETRVTALENR